MSPTSRRTFIYWLLLLLPTLAVGAGAIHLLRREQARIVEQSAQAAESRQAAVAARARLIVENVELLAGDVQDGLLDALEEQPGDELAAFLDSWERDNPLVRVAFVAREDGALLRPNGRASADEARGFVRRFADRLHAQPPWSPATAPMAAVAPKDELRDEALQERQEVSGNVAQIQSARRDVQELLKARNYQAPASPAASVRSRESSGAASSSFDRPAYDRRMAQFAEADPLTGAERSEAKTLKRETVALAARPKPAVSARRGWITVEVDARRHLLGWVQAEAGGEVRGVELDLSSVVTRLADVLPRELGSGEGYALRDEKQQIVHRSGWLPRSDEPAIRVPIASALLSRWEVAAYLAPAAYGGSDGAAFFWVGSLLVGIFAAAILAGGSLLLWQARQSEQEAAQKTSFVANVSHEFKTPLTTIRLYAELLEQGRVRDAIQGGEYLRTIGRETQRLARLVNNALDFSRLEQGKKTFARQPIDLSAGLARLLETHAPRLQDAGLRVDAKLPEAPLVVTTDRDAVEQIVLNLLDNACKYASGGGEATVTLAGRASDGGAEVRVGDRGPGVPPEHRERIFEKFHRVDDTLTAEKSGAGLGLSIARQLARGLGGELRYAPREGGGSEFILELP